ncbi:nitrate- and nitrite sensing domain-containing protein [Streptomyces sp. ISL-100]|uniref:sensor histidine kinase n=1 Tax=Streptomyces sp. ISL-100 TaxID=2819173 RepID=UPI001BECCFBF|nr:nitrate- and nitrite sensing domain-containing protein [Streptomyces sp. ISL-100]MBT2394515.1 nitrate- and nitrite sensing domain-containing protein [Streptomyces sp. ISL-100]
MSPIEPKGQRKPSRARRRRTVRLRTLLILLAVVPTVAMSAQVVVTADSLLDRSEHLRADVAAGERIGVPAYRLMVELQAERMMTAGKWAGSHVSGKELRNRRTATDRAAAEFREAATTGPDGGGKSDHHLTDVRDSLDDLDAHRERADARSGSADRTIRYYTGVISELIHVYQEEFSHTEDAELTQESRLVATMFSASELLAREQTILASAGPSRELTASRFAEYVNAVGAHRYLYETAIVPYLPAGDREFYDQITGSGGWQAKTRIENIVMSDHEDIATGVRLPLASAGWRNAHDKLAEELGALNAGRSQGVLATADTQAAALEAEVAWLIAGSGGALLIVAGVVVFTTRSVLRRLRGLHESTVAIAEKTLPDVVARLQGGQPVDPDALPGPTGAQDEVGRISDAFARVVAVSVDGHRQLSDERHGFGMFAAGIASRTGNLVSRQLSLTEDLQDTFGHNEALLAQLMRSDQLTVGMRRQIENLLILAGGEIPDPHTEPMRVADLLREAAAEVEDFRRIERQALDEISVEPRVISQISHLLAELLDNATRFSPPKSKVVIRAELVADGLLVEIEDRGPRVTPASYEEMNRRLHSAPPYAVLAQNAHRLGLFVVGHLADHLPATVTLRRSVYGGTSAVVIIPAELLVPTEREPAREPARSDRAQPDPVRPDHIKSVPVRPDPAPRRLEVRKPEPASQAKPGLPSRRTPDRPDGSRPALPERVPHTHIAEQLREPRAPQAAVLQDEATPEEVADAWADYEQGTQKVEAELRQDQP